MTDYQDINGNPCSLDALCVDEPAWAANRIRAVIATVKRLTDRNTLINIEATEIGNKASQLRADNRSLTAEVTRLADLYNREEESHGNTIDQRDRTEELATALANLVGEVYGVDVGEHSNLNCPIIEACEELNYVLAMRQAIREPDEVMAAVSGSPDTDKGQSND